MNISNEDDKELKNKDSSQEKPPFDWSTIEIPMNRVSSTKELVNSILDFSKCGVKKLGVKDKIDKDFIQTVTNLKDHNGLIKHLTKPYYQENEADKLLVYYKIDTNLHVKIDKNLIPKEKKVSFFESIKASENLGMGPYKLTRFKIYEEPPKVVQIDDSDEI